MNDRQRLEKIERAFSEPSGDRLLDDLVQMTPQASRHFQHQLEDQLIARLKTQSMTHQTEDENMTTITRNFPAERTQPTRGWATAAALLLIFGGLFALFMNLNPEPSAVIVPIDADSATETIPVVTATPEARRVVVASQDIPRGALISTDLIAIQTVPAHEQVPEGAFSRVVDVYYQIAARDIAAGEYILPELVDNNVVIWSSRANLFLPGQISELIHLIHNTPEIDTFMGSNQPLLALIPRNSAYNILPEAFREMLDNNESLRASFLREHIMEMDVLRFSVSTSFTVHSIHSLPGGGLVQVIDCVLPFYDTGCDTGQPILNRGDLQTRLPWTDASTAFVPLPESYNDELALDFSALSGSEGIPVRLVMSYCALHPDSETCDESIDQSDNAPDELVVLSYAMITTTAGPLPGRPYIVLPDLMTMITVLWAFDEDVPVVIEPVEDHAEAGTSSTGSTPVTITLPADDPMIIIAPDVEAGTRVNITATILFVDSDEEFQQPLTDGDQIAEMLADLQLNSGIITDARVISIADDAIRLEVTENAAAIDWVIETGLPLHIASVDAP